MRRRLAVPSEAFLRRAPLAAQQYRYPKAAKLKPKLTIAKAFDTSKRTAALISEVSIQRGKGSGRSARVRRQAEAIPPIVRAAEVGSAGGSSGCPSISEAA